MKKSLGEIMSDPRIWEMSEEEKRRGRQRIMEIAKREMKSGMLTYKDEEPVMVHAPRVEMMPSPRRGIVGWFKDRLFGYIVKSRSQTAGNYNNGTSFNCLLKNSFKFLFSVGNGCN